MSEPAEDCGSGGKTLRPRPTNGVLWPVDL